MVTSRGKGTMEHLMVIGWEERTVEELDSGYDSGRGKQGNGLDFWGLRMPGSSRSVWFSTTPVMTTTITINWRREANCLMHKMDSVLLAFFPKKLFEAEIKQKKRRLSFHLANERFTGSGGVLGFDGHNDSDWFSWQVGFGWSVDVGRWRFRIAEEMGRVSCGFLQGEFVERLRPGLWLSMGDSVIEGEFGRDDVSGRFCVGAVMEVAVEMAPPSFYFCRDYIFS
ncbi:unnamed protein product [Dovyalis caffra]|uniref:Uncharacterized protein n=1 Tax=Dovyalis caffra TaxID=77055 RepID=A0AAV1R936_9ROSI|nr:unnamed protein product [Dovyalis caffra]